MFSKLERLLSDWNSANKPLEAKMDIHEMTTDFHDIDKASIAPAVVHIDFYFGGEQIRNLYVHVTKQNLEGTDNKYRNTGIALNSSMEIIKYRISESICIAESLEDAAIIFFNKTIDVIKDKDVKNFI